MKVASLLAAVNLQGDWQPYLVHTGQHYDPELSDLFFTQLQIPRPNINLEVGSGSQAYQTAQIMLRFEPVAQEQKPDLVVVVGDVNSTLACALVAAKLFIPSAHVEAGLRSFDRTMPEEINRRLTDALADFLFATEPAAVENLLHEGIPREKIFLVGNVMIDTLRRFLPLARLSSIHQQLHLQAAGGSAGPPYALLTLHRPSNVDEKQQLADLMTAFHRIAQRIPIVFPVHPRTRKQLGEFGLEQRTARGESRFRLMPPIGYLDFVALMERATFVMTDSGGIQEETTALGVPCLTLRENTERPITVTAGTNEVVGTNPDRLLNAVEGILNGETKRGRIPDLWDGAAAERILRVLDEKCGRS